MIQVTMKDGSKLEYPDANAYESNGVQCMIGNRVNGVMEVIAALAVEDIGQIHGAETPEGGAA